MGRGGAGEVPDEAAPELSDRGHRGRGGGGGGRHLRDTDATAATRCDRSC